MRNNRVGPGAARLAMGLIALAALSGCPPEKEPGTGGSGSDPSGRCGLCLDACEARPDTRAQCIADCRDGACKGQ